MGKASRDKGARFERDLVNIMKSGGIDAVRVPLSGMGHEKDGGEFAGDLVVPMFGAREKFEAKKRGEATGFALRDRRTGSSSSTSGLPPSATRVLPDSCRPVGRRWQLLISGLQGPGPV